MAPRVMSRIAILPNASSGPIALAFGGWVGVPVDVSTASGCGEADGANAARLPVGAGMLVGTADWAAVGSDAGGCVTATGAVDVDEAAQTWLNRMDGGGAPKADV